MTRKGLSLLLAALLILGVFSAAPALAASTKNTTVKTARSGDTLYVRKGPHKGNTPTVGVVKNGQAITLYLDSSDDESDGECWSKIKVKSTGAIGYLKNKYIKYLINEYDLDNSDGEIDPHEDDDWDYSDADDNDGRPGTSSGSGGTKSSSASLGVVSTSGGSVNVRSSASTSASKKGTASNGERLTILGKSGSWYRVKTAKGLTGYIYASYVSEGIPGYTTASSGVNMRKGPGTGYAVIKSLKYGTSIRVLSKSGNWSRVKAGTSYGYIHNSYYEYD